MNSMVHRILQMMAVSLSFALIYHCAMNHDEGRKLLVLSTLSSRLRLPPFLASKQRYQPVNQRESDTESIEPGILKNTNYTIEPLNDEFWIQLGSRIPELTPNEESGMEGMNQRMKNLKLFEETGLHQLSTDAQDIRGNIKYADFLRDQAMSSKRGMALAAFDINGHNKVLVVCQPIDSIYYYYKNRTKMKDVVSPADKQMLEDAAKASAGSRATTIYVGIDPDDANYFVMNKDKWRNWESYSQSDDIFTKLAWRAEIPGRLYFKPNMTTKHVNK